MKHCLLGALVVSAIVGTAYAAPLTPVVTGRDINFGAYNTGDVAEWATQGILPDTLTYTREAQPGQDHEDTAYWPNWPTPPVYPIFDDATGTVFGGDFVLNVKFTGQDAPFTNPSTGQTMNVSLVGTGVYTGSDPQYADLRVYGTIPGVAGPGLLWAVNLTAVSLYGHAGDVTPATPPDAYVLEGVGTVVGGLLGQDLVGESAVMRGHLDFPDRPASWIPSLYDPTQSPSSYESTWSDDLVLRASFSGETGLGIVAPEPATMGLLALGGLVLSAIRRRR